VFGEKGYLIVVFYLFNFRRKNIFSIYVKIELKTILVKKKKN